MKKLCATLVVILFPFFLSQEASAFSRSEDHVVTKGKVLKSLRNAPIDKIRVFAMKKGKLRAIPFQIDKVNVDGGFIFDIEEEKDNIDDRKDDYEDSLDDYKDAQKDDDVSKAKLAKLEKKVAKDKRRADWVMGKNKALNPEDELALMAWDLGGKASASMLPKAAKIEELKITNPTDSSSAYAYVALFKSSPPALSKNKYLEYEPKKDYINADYYTIKFQEDNPFLFTDGRLKDSNGKLGENFIDRFKMRIKMDLKFFFTMNFDENNTNGKRIAYKIGPVRVIKRILFWMEIGFLRVTPKVIIDLVFYPNGMIAPGIINSPFTPKSVMNKGSYMRVGQDFNDSMIGSKMYTKKTKPVTIDGKMSSAEKALDLKNKSWFVVYREGKSGFFSQLKYDKRLPFVKGDIWYQDDKDVDLEPEDTPGQHIIGWKADVLQFPKGKYYMYIYMYMSRKWAIGQEKRYLNFIANPLKSKAKKIK